MDEVLNRIICEMVQQGKKQKDLTDFLNINKNAFTDWKSGKNLSYKKYIYAIAEYLNVSVDYLLDKTDIKKEPTTNNSDKLDSNLVSVLIQLSPELLEKVYIYAQGLLAASKTQPKPSFRIVPVETEPGLLRKVGRDGSSTEKHLTDEEIKEKREYDESLEPSPDNL